MNVQIVRSARRTLALQVTRDGQVIVRAPFSLPQREIDRFLSQKKDWLQKHLAMAEAPRSEPTAEDEERCRKMAMETLPSLIARYAPLVGRSPAGITVTGARTRYGSCSCKGRVCFSWRLFLHPTACVEYVVVHELCHLIHFDHSPAFWREVERVMPDYRKRKALLKEDV